MEPFKKLETPAIALPLANVDTDQLIRAFHQPIAQRVMVPICYTICAEMRVEPSSPTLSTIPAARARRY